MIRTVYKGAGRVHRSHEGRRRSLPGKVTTSRTGAARMVWRGTCQDMRPIQRHSQATVRSLDKVKGQYLAFPSSIQSPAGTAHLMEPTQKAGARELLILSRQGGLAGHRARGKRRRVNPRGQQKTSSSVMLSKCVWNE